MPEVIEIALPEDIEQVNHLLRIVNLPTEGLEDHLDNLLVMRRGDAIISCGALEVYGQYALLRSLAVQPDLQGFGLGREITKTLLEMAKLKEIKAVFLLTETASDFFFSLGFKLIGRNQIAEPVQQSQEFTTLCPASATAMKMDL